MDGDEEPVGVEAVHLDKPVLVGRGAVDDDEDEVVVVVDLRPLAELLGILNRERVELEAVAQDLEVGAVRPVEVQPEEALPRKERVDRLAVEVDLPAAVVVDDVALRGHGKRRGRGRRVSCHPPIVITLWIIPIGAEGDTRPRTRARLGQLAARPTPPSDRFGVPDEKGGACR